MTLVLFPLSAHLLPGGIMPLRIFEPRYQRMIAESRSGSSRSACWTPPARRAAQHVPHRHPGAHHRFRSAARWFARHHGARGGAGAHHGSLAGRGRSAGRRGWSPLPLAERQAPGGSALLAKALQDVSTTIRSTRPSIRSRTGRMRAGPPSAGWRCCPSRWNKKQWLVAAGDNQPTLSLLSGLLVASH